MYATPYPDFFDFAVTYCAWMAIFNLAGLAVTVVWWAISDQRMLRANWPRPEELSRSERRQILNDLRGNYWYFERLPLFVDRSPLRLAMNRSSAPSLGPVLVVATLQSIPFVSLFGCVWYTIHAGWHIFKFLEKQVKEKTPSPVKRLLFTTWF